MTVKRKTAFISYSWDNESHEEWVLDLTNKLRAEGGIEANCDKFELYTQTVDMYSMMIEQIEKNDYVILILTEGYYNKALQKEGGVGFETMLINPLLNENKDKLIFITRDENRQKTTPFQMKSFYSIDFSKEENFASKFKELLHRVYQTPLYEKAALGNIPLLEPQKVSVLNTKKQKELVVVDNRDTERVLWLLPRGFLIFDDITYQSSNSWSVTAHHFDYEGEWIHGTHYHESYESSWDRNLETQFSKLRIPKSDHFLAVSALRFLQSLRHANQESDIQEKVRELDQDDLVKYFSEEAPIFLPDIPGRYTSLYKTGTIRDLVESVDDISRLSYNLEPNSFKVEEAHSYARKTRRRVYISMNEYFGDENSNMRFITEIIDRYSENMTLKELGDWAQELKMSITDLVE
ncbi:TIR domain-containing protein [Priestia filamentosa]|uniref:TIR domain-containing protein n=1 Tax=Priestia filamentosa TaxID=1402861 RepID=UPI003F15DB43